MGSALGFRTLCDNPLHHNIQWERLHMTAQLIDGKALARSMEAKLAERIRALPRKPVLAVLLVGEDPASRVYVRNKVLACERTGIESRSVHLPETATEEDVIRQVRAWNEDPTVDGILVQLPLPRGINAERVIETVALEKDVDGFHVGSAGALMTGRAGFRPCTPSGVMEMLDSIGYELRGKHALVIGRSNIVGKPMAMMLLEKDATVTVAHSRTPNTKELAKAADVIVAAAGRADLVTADMVKPGAVVIDVGMNRRPDGRLCGDAADDVRDAAGWLTPVPGGVGPMTIAMLLVNTVRSAEMRLLAQ